MTEPPHPRIGAADAFPRWFDHISPAAKFRHPFRTFDPEEESLLLEHCLISGVLTAFSSLTNSMEELPTQNPTITFEYLRDMLKYLQWQSGHNNPWVLKSPLYYGLEPFTLDVFRDAHLLMPHRTPHQTVPGFSSCWTPSTSLFQTKARNMRRYERGSCWAWRNI